MLLLYSAPPGLCTPPRAPACASGPCCVWPSPAALPGRDRLILAARNVHRSFVYAAALLDLPVRWLWPQAGGSLCSCPVTGEELDQALSSLPRPPAAVYVTSPDYLGLMQPIEELAQVCHRHGTLLLVDNAHGAYLHFLPKPCHPMDLGADLCCDSAHKTLPVLTGGAYLHISRQAPPAMASRAKQAMAMFGSTSPSYLTLASLDLCNGYLAGSYRERLHRLRISYRHSASGFRAWAGTSPRRTLSG